MSDNTNTDFNLLSYLDVKVPLRSPESPSLTLVPTNTPVSTHKFLKPVLSPPSSSPSTPSKSSLGKSFSSLSLDQNSPVLNSQQHSSQSGTNSSTSKAMISLSPNRINNTPSLTSSVGHPALISTYNIDYAKFSPSRHSPRNISQTQVAMPETYNQEQHSLSSTVRNQQESYDSPICSTGLLPRRVGQGDTVPNVQYLGLDKHTVGVTEVVVHTNDPYQPNIIYEIHDVDLESNAAFNQNLKKYQDELEKEQQLNDQIYLNKEIEVSRQLVEKAALVSSFNLK